MIAVVKLATAFHRRTDNGHYMISTHIPIEISSIPPLVEFDLEHQLTEWLDYMLVQDRAYLPVKEVLDDDIIPTICPFFGFAEHSAWLGKEALLQEDTCLPISPKSISRRLINGLAT